jgi:hypothetical protein
LFSPFYLKNDLLLIKDSSRASKGYLMVLEATSSVFLFKAVTLLAAVRNRF